MVVVIIESISFFLTLSWLEPSTIQFIQWISIVCLKKKIQRNAFIYHPTKT